MEWSKRLESELKFRFTRSSGSGGQHVNKVATRVELYLDIKSSKLLLSEEKQVLLIELKSRIDKKGVLRLCSQKSRQQAKNKKLVVAKLNAVLSTAFEIKKLRIQSKAAPIVNEKRLNKKKHLASKKELRKKVNLSTQIDLFSFNCVSFVEGMVGGRKSLVHDGIMRLVNVR